MKNTIIIIIAIFTITSMNAQSEMTFAAHADFAVEESNVAFGAFGEALTTEEVASINFAKVGKVATNFTGYTVELTNSRVALTATHPMFAEFGGITLEEGFQSFRYAVGSFNTKEAAQDFINNTIQDRYPEAQIVAYFNGKAATQPTKVVQCFELMD